MGMVVHFLSVAQTNGPVLRSGFYDDLPHDNVVEEKTQKKKVWVGETDFVLSHLRTKGNVGFGAGGVWRH